MLTQSLGHPARNLSSQSVVGQSIHLHANLDMGRLLGDQQQNRDRARQWMGNIVTDDWRGEQRWKSLRWTREWSGEHVPNFRQQGRCRLLQSWDEQLQKGVAQNEYNTNLSTTIPTNYQQFFQLCWHKKSKYWKKICPKDYERNRFDCIITILVDSLILWKYISIYKLWNFSEVSLQITHCQPNHSKLSSYNQFIDC
jgi:hypothetical protein